MAKLIAWVISLGIVLGQLGLLQNATLYLATEAARHQQKGMLSLRQLNRTMTGPPTPRKLSSSNKEPL